jgi:hypothetical protein
VLVNYLCWIFLYTFRYTAVGLNLDLDLCSFAKKKSTRVPVSHVVKFNDTTIKTDFTVKLYNRGFLNFITNILKYEETGELSIFGNFGRG